MGPAVELVDGFRRGSMAAMAALGEERANKFPPSHSHRQTRGSARGGAQARQT